MLSGTGLGAAGLASVLLISAVAAGQIQREQATLTDFPRCGSSRASAPKEALKRGNTGVESDHCETKIDSAGFPVRLDLIEAPTLL